MADQHSSDQQSYPETGPGSPASLGARFLALLVDWILCVLLSMLIAKPPANSLWISVVFIAEYALFLGLFAQTPGMRLAGIRCVAVASRDVAAGAAIGIPRAALRGVLLSLIIPALPIFMDANGRGWHDRLSGSIVLNTR